MRRKDTDPTIQYTRVVWCGVYRLSSEILWSFTLIRVLDPRTISLAVCMYVYRRVGDNCILCRVEYIVGLFVMGSTAWDAETTDGDGEGDFV